MNPKAFIKNGPQKPEDLIGKARTVAHIYCEMAKSGETTPIQLLLYGQPGVGKSATCRIIANALAHHPSAISHLSAGQLTVDHVKQWMNDFRYYHDQWRVYWIEEVDAVNPAVEVLLLQFIDEMPDRNAILVTSNEMMSGISARFQSRMQAIRFDKPEVDDVEKFLLNRWPELGDVAKEIAEANNGDVRASLNDSQAELNARQFGEKKS